MRTLEIVVLKPGTGKERWSGNKWELALVGTPWIAQTVDSQSADQRSRQESCLYRKIHWKLQILRRMEVHRVERLRSKLWRCRCFFEEALITSFELFAHGRARQRNSVCTAFGRTSNAALTR